MTTRTAMLWLQYLDMISILQRFIKAKRDGQLETTPSNSTIHVAIFRSIWSFTLCKVCIRITANHAMSARNSSRCAPEMHGRIPRGEMQRHVWAGLFTDLIIEQVLMISINTHGGLTRGKGMTENQRLVWVLSMPVCASINETVQQFNGVSYETSISS